MRKVALIPVALAACGLLALSAGAQETASSTPTIDQSLEWKAALNPKISPDGMRVVYEIQKTNWEENAFERNLWIADIPAGESHALTSAKKSSTNAAWSPDGKWIAFLSDRPGQITGTPDGKKQLYVISADGGEAQQLTKVENDVHALEWAPDSKRIAFSMTDPEPKALKDRKEKYGDYSVVHADYQMMHLWTTEVPGGGALVAEPKRLTDGDKFSVGEFSWSPDGTCIAVSAQRDAGLIGWGLDGIYFAAEQKTYAHLFRLNPETKAIEKLSAPDHVAAFSFSFSRDYKEVAYRAALENQYAEVFTSSIAPWQGKKLTAMSDQLKGFALAHREVISWKSADGTTIEGVLYTPSDFSTKKKYPLLVVIHGGPTGVDQPIVSADRYYPIERFVAKGALVLRPDYRGSAGYGEKSRALNVRNLGVGDYADVISGVDALIAKGWVDKERMGSMGWSQGGYISAFITASSDRFKAVSVGAGISDWMTYYANTDITPFTPQYLHATPWDDPEVYKKTSPISYIAKAKTPTLIQHGENDRRVPIPNAFELRQALEDRGVPVKMVVYKGFGHGITKPKQQRAVMEENEKWFARYIWGEKPQRSEEHTSELQSRSDLVCRLLLEKKKKDK